MRRYVEEFKKIPIGVFIENPGEKIYIEKFSISRRALKHFVESRMAQNADIEKAVKILGEVLVQPEINLENTDSVHIGSRLVGSVVAPKKALMIVIDKNAEVVSIHYKNIKQFNKIKDHTFAGGEAAAGAEIRSLPL